MTDCIEWTGRRNDSGYGMVYRRGLGDCRAHRVAFEASVGPIPDGMCVCHRCDNRACINPDHLFLGTHADNMRDAAEKGRFSHWDRAKGSRSGKAKLTEETAVYAMARLLAGESQSSVARAFGVDQPAISKLWLGKTWQHCFTEV